MSARRGSIRHRRHGVESEIGARARHDLGRNVNTILLCKLVGVIIHDDGHAVHAETVCLGHHSLSESVRNVVRAKKSGEHDKDMKGHDGKRDSEPPRQYHPLELEVIILASRQDAASIARLTDGSLNERAEIPAASKPILDAQPTNGAKLPGPLSVDFTLEIKGFSTVGNVTGCDKEGEANPEGESVDRQK